jgi:hypothetical protein
MVKRLRERSSLSELLFRKVIGTPSILIVVAAGRIACVASSNCV